jgi:hypothetical protein
MANPILHKVKAQLYDIALTEDPNDYIARVSAERSLSVKDICTNAVARGGADVPVATMEHSVNLFLTEMGYDLCDGYSVNTGWFTATPHIKGVFHSPSERFDSSKHSFLFELQPGIELRKEGKQVSVEILGVAETGLTIAQVTDVKTGSVNDTITPNRNLRIAGRKLKIAGESATNGVTFVNQDTAARTKVDATDIVVNNPSELIVVVPELEKGTYLLEVASQFCGSSNLLKEPSITTYDKTLTVQ